MRVFSVGDVLIGNEHNNYRLTNRENPCIVTDHNLDIAGKIQVRVLGGDGSGRAFWVYPDRFNLVDSTPFEGNV